MTRMVRAGALAIALGVTGCASVKLVQRDGCWIRQTSRPLGGSTEEIGPCNPPEPEWSDDRLTRVVQECVARAEHRWQTRALAAWNQRQPMPERANDAGVLQDCMDETSRALSTDNDRLRQQNDLLSTRMRDAEKERDALRTRADDTGARLLSTHEKLSDRLLTDQEKLGDRLAGAQDRMAGYLGEAAKKASQPAVATANATSHSDGAVTTDTSTGATAVPAANVTSTPARSLLRARRAGPKPAAVAARTCGPSGSQSTKPAAASQACVPSEPSVKPSESAVPVRAER